MQFQRITNPDGIDDIKLIGETPDEISFIRQLAQVGTLTTTSSLVTTSVIFRPISLNFNNQNNDLLSFGKIGKLDFTIRQNQNFLVDLNFNSNGAPINLTTYTAIKLQVKTSKSSGAIVSLTIGSGLTIIGGSNNILSVKFSPAQTKLLCDNEYYYDLLASKPDSNSYFVEGKITIDKTVTN